MDYLVKIRSVQTPLNGQFSIGANSGGLQIESMSIDDEDQYFEYENGEYQGDDYEDGEEVEDEDEEGDEKSEKD